MFCTRIIIARHRMDNAVLFAMCLCSAMEPNIVNLPLLFENPGAHRSGNIS